LLPEIELGPESILLAKSKFEMRKKASHFQLLMNIIIMMLAIYIIIYSVVDIGFGTLRSPQSGLFPFISGILILITDIAVMLQKSKETEPAFENRSQIKTFFYILIVFVSWIVVMPYLGYVIISFLVIVLIAKIMKLEGWLKPIVLAVGITVLIYLLFDYWLYIDLPRGILG